jgi:para-nitrobenzyl esterase
MFKLVFAIVLASLSAHAIDINTRSGVVTGFPSGTAFVFKGIPYAAPPVGDLRWAAPQDPVPWKSNRLAYSYSSKCPQASLANKSIRFGDEDCLYLNVFRPQNITKPLPVMVFIHGGGNTVGSAADAVMGTQLYDGETLASQNVIVVTLNYRLGALGFLAHPALKSKDGLEGNYALLDQIAALKYVRDNIANFGGDPGNVTLFGESAGAINTLALISSPLAKGLFHRAIIESGFLNDLPLVQAEKQGADFAKAAKCETAECLRALSASDVVGIYNGMSQAALQSAGATIDGVVLKESVLGAMRAGRAMNIPVIIGSNADEMRTLMDAVVPNASLITDQELTKLLIQNYGAEKAAKIEAEYRSKDYEKPARRLEEILGDSFVHCPTREISRALSQYNSQTYRYVFSHVAENIYLSPYGAGHGLELPYVFGNMSMMVYSRAEFALSQNIRNWWTTFAETGEPDVLNQPAWKPVAGDAYMNIDTTSGLKTAFRQDRCEFWAN